MKHRISTISATWNAWNAWNAPVIRHRSKFEKGLGVSRHFGSSERASAVSSGCSLEYLGITSRVSPCFLVFCWWVWWIDVNWLLPMFNLFNHFVEDVH